VLAISSWFTHEVTELGIYAPLFTRKAAFTSAYELLAVLCLRQRGADKLFKTPGQLGSLIGPEE
jgi:hypothetical protein